MNTTISIDKVIDFILEKTNKNVVLATPLGIGKANTILNALYVRAKNDPTINLTICSALTLNIPTGNSDLEKRFLGPFTKRVFGNYVDLEYEKDRLTETMPTNIKVIEFYFPAGKYMNIPLAQQNYISSNYTHVVRDLKDRGINVIVQLIAKEIIADSIEFSLSSNPDVTPDLVNEMGKENILIIGEVNHQLPFMFGDAYPSSDFFDLVYDNQATQFDLFAAPRMSVPDQDYMIGLYASSLVKDDGEIQVGIGSLGDAVVYNLIHRHQQNAHYQELLNQLNVFQKFGNTIEKIGDTAPFRKGLFGASEMMVDGFMHLVKADILKKKTYDHIKLQRLINANIIDPKFDNNILQILLDHHVIQQQLSQEDFLFCHHFGIFKETVTFDGQFLHFDNETFDVNLSVRENLENIQTRCLGDELKNGHIIQAGFFLGPKDFYQWLKEMPLEQRKQIVMKSVKKINQLYGHEQIDRLHRKNARFINTCMMATLSGAAVSDGLKDGRVVSGVGGQYNFVAMAQELEDGHSIICMRSTRIEDGQLVSNVVYNYGHITIPRHLRDIVITEYGVANLRGKTDSEVIKELLNITDSRFQETLLYQAKNYGKIEKNYRIPELFKKNLPDSYKAHLKHYKSQGYFPDFPFGTELTSIEVKLAKALKALKRDLKDPLNFLIIFIKALRLKKDARFDPYLERLELLHAKNLKAKIYQKLISYKLKDLLP